ncbi:MAG: phosphoadenylyl-sulfate reductase [Aquificaceae bacterium]
MDKIEVFEEILEKNPRERLKVERHPLDILEDLPRIIRDGYEKTPEEDIVRLQWYGLYHDKPRIGHFLLRIKLPAGKVSPKQLKEIGRLAEQFNNYAELTTRQDIQLHYIRLDNLPEVFERLSKVGLFPVGACGDTVRNITSCPLSGIDREEIFDVSFYIEELEGFFHNPENKSYFNLPRKFKITLSSCPYHCNYPEMHDLAFVGTVKDGVEGFAVWVGGGLSSTPRLARRLGIFIPKEKVLETARAVVDIWSEEPENRRSFVKARIKYFIDKVGVDKFREMLLERLSFTPEALEKEPSALKRNFHVGVGSQKQEGLFYVGFPIPAGRVSGSQLIKVAELAEGLNLSIRLSQRQNLILASIPGEELDPVINSMEEIGLSLKGSLAKSISIACTSDPFCNYSVGSSKEWLLELLDHLEERLGDIGDIAIGVDGCPHACAHHWLNDIGLQATHIRHPDGSVESGVNIVLGGGYGRQAGIGRIVAKRVPLPMAKEYMERLILAYRESGYESFQDFIRAHSEEELLSIMQAVGKEEKGKIRVRIFGPITRFFGGLSEVEISASTVGEAFRRLEEEFKDFRGRAIDEKGELKPYIKVFLNEEDVRFLKGIETPLKEGDEIALYPALAGGSPLYDEMELHELALEYEDRPAQDVIAWSLESFHPRLYLAWSGQAEDMVLLDMAYKINPQVRVFTIDTGRLHEETYKLMEKVYEVYGLIIEVYFPDREEVENMVKEFGVNLFYRSVDLRHLCCHIRKVRPLVRALREVDAWITGLRREQWASRHNIMKIEVDHDHGQIVKINPLADWTEKEVWNYIKENKVPYNELYEKGFKSIGCAPCTRAIAEYEDPRAGRWWWEKDAPKECGIHCSLETGGFERIADKVLRRIK